MFKKGAGPGVAQTSTLQARLDTLERENASLRSNMSQNQALLQENYQLRGRLQSLEGRLNTPGSTPAIPLQQPVPTTPNPAPR
jgi:hypothetical protein